MARIRNVKPDFYDDIKLADYSRDHRYLYKAMWHWLDRLGVGERDGRFWKAKVFPYDNDINVTDVDMWITDLVTGGFLIEFSHKDKSLILAKNMPEHQHFHKDEAPKYFESQEELNGVLRRWEEHHTSTVQAPGQHQVTTVVTALKSEIRNQRSEIGNLKSEPPAVAKLDFESAIKPYPRKDRKAKALKELAKQVRDQERLDEFDQAVGNYAKHCAAKDKPKKYIMQLATFVGTASTEYRWHDWIDPDPEDLVPDRSGSPARGSPGIPDKINELERFRESQREREIRT